MFRITSKPGLLKLAIGATALVAAGMASLGSSEAHDSRYDHGYERPGHGWRPTPPAFHGFWGARQWRRHHEGYGVRPAPPPPSAYYRYGWR